MTEKIGWLDRLDKVGHGCWSSELGVSWARGKNESKSFVLGDRKKGNISQIFHEGIGFPSQEELQLDRVGSAAVQEDASANTDGMGGVAIMFRELRLGQIVCLTSDGSESLGDDTGVDKQCLFVVVTIDGQRGGSVVDVDQEAETLDDAVECSDPTEVRVVGVADDAALFTVFLVLLVRKLDNSLEDRGTVAQEDSRLDGLTVRVEKFDVAEGDGTADFVGIGGIGSEFRVVQMTELVILGPFTFAVAHVQAKVVPIFLGTKKAEERGMTFAIHALEGLVHFEGVRVEALVLLLIAFAFFENAVDERRHALIRWLVKTRIAVAVSNEESGHVAKVCVDGLGTNGLAFDGVALGKVEGIGGKNHGAGLVIDFFEEEILFWPFQTIEKAEEVDSVGENRPSVFGRLGRSVLEVHNSAERRAESSSALGWKFRNFRIQGYL